MHVLERYRLATTMLGWSHAELLAFVREHASPGGLFVVRAPLPPESEWELEADADGVRVVFAPDVAPASDDPEAVFFVHAIDRRAAQLRAVLIAARETPRIQGAELADRESVHASHIERIVRGRRVRIDGETVALERLVDLEGEVCTTRPSVALTAVIDPCKQSYGLGDERRTEWPNNVLSVRTVVLEGGVVAREGDGTIARYRPAEHARAERLANDAAAILAGLLVRMKSESDETFAPFHLGPRHDAPPAHVDEAFVRALFALTIAPHDTVRVAPFAPGSDFWREAVEDDDERRARFEALARFFVENGLTTPVGVWIGSFERAPAAPPPAGGFESCGSCLPRLILAFTPYGSAVGVFGHVVWT